MSDDLLPCPFCGGEAAHNEGGGSVFGRMWWTVGCKTCDIWFSDPEVWSKTDHGMLDPAYPPKHCFTAWNRRALPATDARDEVERLRGAGKDAADAWEECLGHVVAALGEKPDWYGHEAGLIADFRAALEGKA